MDVLKDLILINKDEKTELFSSVVNAGQDYVALLFSVNWSPPCHKFLPLLSDFVNKIKEEGIETLRVIYVPGDSTEDEMLKYFKEKHGDWWAVQFDQEISRKIQETFNIRCVPKLVIIAPSGDVITTKGRRDIQDTGVLAYTTWVMAAKRKDSQEARLRARRQGLMDSWIENLGNASNDS